jgi:transcriptional regulator with XRE-family HTH domain
MPAPLSWGMAVKPDWEFLARLGRRVRTLRQLRGMSQEDLSLECELNQTYISGIERGRRNVTIHNLRVVAHALKVTMAEFFEGLD